MKKFKLIGITATVLLAVSSITAVAPASAADISKTASPAPTASSADALTPKAYFTYKGTKLDDYAYLPVGNGLPVKNGITIKELISAATENLKLESNIKTATTRYEMAPHGVIIELIEQGVKVNGNDENATIDLGSVKSFNLNVSAMALNSANGKQYGSTIKTVIVPFNSSITSESDPAIVGQYDHNGSTVQINPNGQTFQIAANSAFDPTNIKLTNGETIKLVGQQSASDTKSAKVDVVSNPVDTSQAGNGYTVKLAVTNSAGKQTEISYKVFVRPTGIFQLNLLPRNWVNGLEDQSVYYQGEKFYIGTNIEYQYGQFYSELSRKEGERGGHLLTKYLANSKTAAPKIVQKTIMHKALAYGRGGTKTRKVYPAFEKVYVNNEPIQVDGGKYYTSGTFYQIYNADGTYTNYFVKVSNIDGTKRTLTKNAYIYSTSTRRTSFNGSWKLTKGSTVTTYGGSYRFKNGKRYYRIGGPAKQYVRTANF